MKPSVPDRQALIAQCRHDLELRRAGYLRELESLDEAAAGETKSSAGDKYETGREMIAQSRNLIAHNLAETDAALDGLDRMAAAPPGIGVAFGSLVETNQGWHLVGVSLGEVKIGELTVRAISLASPLGQALKGKGVGQRIPWRGASLEILLLRP